MSDQISDQGFGGTTRSNADASKSKNGSSETPPAIGKKSQTNVQREATPVATEKSGRGAHDAADEKHVGRAQMEVPQKNANEGESQTAVDAGIGATRPEKHDKRIIAKLRAHPIAIAVSAIAIIAGAIGGTVWYLHSRHYANTDDAFIDGRPIYVNLQVTGNIVAVPVTDNQIVKVGDLLVQIDDRDYRAAVDLAQAQIDQAEANIDNFSAQVYAQEAQVAQVQTQVVQAQATLEFSQQQNTRFQDLVTKGAGTVQRAEQAISELQATTAALATAQAAKMVAERQITVLRAQRKNAQGQLGQAQAQKATADANLTRTQLRATADGRITRLTAAVGQLATQAQGVMILVPLDVWVTANFKETQLADIKVGQAVEIIIDAFGRSFPGHVDSVQSGSGTAFSLLPAQNATGNYVKVVQRIPVKITFDGKPDVQLGPGMSVVPTVTIR
jgi:membrane fusion protein, multidrug efflux system